MKLYLVERAIRNTRDFITYNLGRILGREFISNPGTLINIEVTSICNLKCRFCAYQKKESAKVTMSNDFFEDCIEQAVKLGFTKFGLTPITGDVFMDPALFDKLAFLENHPAVESYYFFTNFTIPDQNKIERLLKLKKLEALIISIYGHDLDSFIKVTQSSQKIYQRLVKNLTFLLSRINNLNFYLEIGWRSYNKIPWNTKSDLKCLLDKFKSNGIKVRRSLTYSNWGGSVTQADVEDLGITINSANTAYKNGACSMLLNNVMIKADGTVNGCPCRDVEAKLKIGDLKQESLSQILSYRNDRYIDLINDQQAGNFLSVCDNCDFYKSIYKPKFRRQSTKIYSLSEFYKEILRKDRIDE